VSACVAPYLPACAANASLPTPLTDDPDWHMSWSAPLGSGSSLIVSRWQLTGAALVALGLMVTAGRVGFQLGRRGAEPPEQA